MTENKLNIALNVQILQLQNLSLFPNKFYIRKKISFIEHKKVNTYKMINVSHTPY